MLLHLYRALTVSRFACLLQSACVYNPLGTDLLSGRRYYHPSPPARTVKQERSFEGISLETPGASSKSVLQMSRFQLCGDCFGAAKDAAAVVRVICGL